MANCDDGRPPVETASPTGPTRPSFMSASMRRATVERARPVIAESSVRVRGRPSRRIWKRSLATEEPRAVMCPSLASRLMSVIVLLFHVFWSKGPRFGRREPPQFGCHDGYPSSPAAWSAWACSTLHGLRTNGTDSAALRKSATSDPSPFHDFVGCRPRVGAQLCEVHRAHLVLDDAVGCDRAVAEVGQHESQGFDLDAEFEPHPASDGVSRGSRRGRGVRSRCWSTRRARCVCSRERRVRSIRPSASNA